MAQNLSRILSGGALIAADSLFGDGHYESAAETIEPAQAIRIPLSLLRYYVEKDHAVALRMLKMLSADQKQRRREIEHLNIQNAPQRIACFLLRLWRQQKSDLTPHLDLPYDKTLIAARLGMRPETFSRALNKLQKDTDLSINGARVDLSQIDQLGTYACQNCSALNTADYIASPGARPHETEDPTHTNQCRVSDPKNS